jgi:hypothetical protein
MAEKGVVECEYFVGDRFCKAIIENDEGKRVREESCVNESKDSCCYLCAHRKSCEVSCSYLDKPADITRAKVHIDQEFIGEYLGGHPAFPKKSNVHLILEAQNLVVHELGLSIPYRNIKRIENMTKDKITATRVLLLGIVGALWKKEQLYMVLTYRDKAAGNDLSMVFKMEKIEKVQPLIYQKMVNARAKK